jgi:hypothetical protein
VRKPRKPQVRALAVKKKFEPSHMAAQCLAQASERLVPILRRPVHLPRPLTSRPDPREEQPRERRHAGRILPWPLMLGCPRINKPKPRQSLVRWQPCVPV